MIFYPDISNAGNHGLHLEQTTVAVAAKASEGNDFDDPSYQFNKEQAKKIKALFFGYHWVWSANEDEIRFAKKISGKTPIFLDCENTKVNITVPIIVAFVTGYRKLGGICNAVYLPEWYWNSTLGSPDLTPLVKLGLTLISSYYIPDFPGHNEGWKPYGGMTPTIWQYTSSLPYGAQHHPCDFNAFHGSVKDLKKTIYGKHHNWYWFPGFWRQWHKFHPKKK